MGVVRLRGERIVRLIVWSSLFISTLYFVFQKNRLRGRRGPRNGSRGSSSNNDTKGSRGTNEGSRWLLAKSPQNIYLLVGLLLTFSLLKSLLITLLGLDMFTSHRWLDCFILGRISLSAYFAMAGRLITIAFVVFVSSWIATVLLLRPDFTLESIEFLLVDYEQVLAIEAKMGGSGGAGRRDRLPRAPLGLERYIQGQGEAAAEARDLFFLFDRSTGEPKIRPNRTASARLRLSRFVLSYSISAVTFMLLASPFAIYIIWSSLLSQQGFELYYNLCTDYIVRHQPLLAINASTRANPNSNYPHHLFEELLSQIYVPTKTVGELARERLNAPAVLPTRPFVNLRAPYHWLRIFLDLFETSFIWMLAGFSFFLDTFIAFVQVYDLFIYFLHVEQALQLNLNHLKRLEIFRRTGEPSSMVQLVHRKSPSVASVQTLQMDFFRLVGSYDAYISLVIAFSVCLWLIISLMVCVHILDFGGGTRSKVRAEVYLIELFISVNFFAVVGSFAAARRRFRQLYSLLASNMALDQDVHNTKLLWVGLLKYFQPRPIYCFTIFGFTEISWFFCLKVSLRQSVWRPERSGSSRPSHL